MAVIIEEFEKARKLFPGKKKGHEREYKNFLIRSTKPVPRSIKFPVEEVALLLLPAIEYQIRYRKWCKENETWVAQWKNFQTWINNGCWEDEHPDFPDSFRTTEDTKLSQENNRSKRQSLLDGARHVKS